MEIKKYKVKIRLTEPLLGTVPKNQDIYKRFIAEKASELNKDEETATVPTADELESRGWTGFHSDEKGNFIYDYLIKGFMKEAGRTLKQVDGLKQLRDKINRYVFVFPRRIRLPKIEKEPLERSLRAETAMGPRTCLTRSDVIAEGTELEFTLEVLTSSGIREQTLEEILSYGKYCGLGQWRNGSYGRFELVSLKQVKA